MTDGLAAGMAVAGSLAHIHAQLRAMLTDVDANLPLPAAGESGDWYGSGVTASLWDTGWCPGTWHSDETLKVIANPESPDGGRPCVYLRGLTGSGDLVAVSVDDALRVARALLAAAKATHGQR